MGKQKSSEFTSVRYFYYINVWSECEQLNGIIKIIMLDPFYIIMYASTNSEAWCFEKFFVELIKWCLTQPRFWRDFVRSHLTRVLTLATLTSYSFLTEDLICGKWKQNLVLPRSKTAKPLCYYILSWLKHYFLFIFVYLKTKFCSSNLTFHTLELDFRGRIHKQSYANLAKFL